MDVTEPESLTWSSELETGLAAIDRDHRQIMALIQEMLAAADDRAPRERMTAALDAFAAHVDAHFVMEEGAMREASFPMHAEHAEQHAVLRDYVVELRETLERHGDIADIVEMAVPLVANALLMHIEVYDRTFADFMHGVG